MSAAVFSMADSGNPPDPAMAERISPIPGVKVALRRALPDLDSRHRDF